MDPLKYLADLVVVIVVFSAVVVIMVMIGNVMY